MLRTWHLWRLQHLRLGVRHAVALAPPGRAADCLPQGGTPPPARRFEENDPTAPKITFKKHQLPDLQQENPPDLPPGSLLAASGPPGLLLALLAPFLARSWAPLGPLLAVLGPLLGRSWTARCLSWPALGLPGSLLGPFGLLYCFAGRIWPPGIQTWTQVGLTLPPCWAHGGPYGFNLASSWHLTSRSSDLVQSGFGTQRESAEPSEGHD